MRKLISILLVVLLLVTAIACDPESGTGNDVTFDVVVSAKKVVEAEANSVAYVDNITKWTYTAVKGDDGYTTGETKEETDLKDGDLTLSLGHWTITVNGYSGENKTYTGTYDTKDASITADTKIAVEVKPVEDVKEGDIKFYSDLSKAVEEAANGATVTLVDDVNLTSAVKIGSKDAAQKTLTINMNGKNVSGKTDSSNRTSLFDICNAKVTFDGEGTIQDTGKYFGEIMVRGSSASATDYTVVTVNKGITCKDGQAVWVDKNSEDAYSKNYGIVVNFYGKVDMKDTVDYAFYVQGLNAEKIDNAPVFNIEGATIETKGEGIYAAGYSKWNIKNTKITTATNGINIAAGELTIGDDASDTTEIVAASTKTAVDTKNGSTSTTIAAAVHVKQHTTKLPVTVTINGGKFSGYAPFNWEKGQSGVNAEPITISIKGGTFTSNRAEGSASVMKDEGCTGKFITGGTFTTDPTSCVAEGYTATKTASGDTWTVAQTKSQQ